MLNIAIVHVNTVTFCHRSQDLNSSIFDVIDAIIRFLDAK